MKIDFSQKIEMILHVILHAKTFSLFLYISAAILASYTEFRWPLRLLAVMGFIAILVLLEGDLNKGEKYQRISIHLFGLLIAVHTGFFKIW